MSSAKLRTACGTSVAALILNVVAAHASVEISAAPTSNMNCSAGMCSPTAKKAVLNVTDLTSMLASSDVKVTTGNGAITITVESPFSWASTSRLTLDAIQNVSFKAPVTVAGTGAVTITYNDGGTGGDLHFFPGGKLNFWDTSSSLVIDGQVFKLESNVKQLSDDIQANPFGDFALAQSYDATHNKAYLHCAVCSTFSGFFDGLGNTISGLRLKKQGQSLTGAGFFSSIGAGATVRDIGVTNATIQSRNTRETNYFGLVAENNSGSIFHAFATGTIDFTGENGAAGGMVGTNSGNIVDSHASVTILEGASSGAVAGGLVGSNGGTITDCDADGQVAASVEYSGGLVGFNSNLVSNSHASGAVTNGAYSSTAGGLVGLNNGTISNAYASGAVTDTNIGAVGGLVGENLTGKIFASFASGDVTTPWEGAGGLVGGTNGGEIQNSYATGTANGGENTSYGTGGLVGTSSSTGDTAEIETSYSLGQVSGKGILGGLVGVDNDPAGHIQSTSWDMNKSGINNPHQGAGNIPNDPGITGLTDAQLKSGLPGGFDPNIWAQKASINNGYPYLIANPPQ